MGRPVGELRGSDGFTQETAAATLAAKVKCLSVALGAQGRTFVHHHAANRVYRHKFRAVGLSFAVTGQSRVNLPSFR
jgi:hypothetical protein